MSSLVKFLSKNFGSCNIYSILCIKNLQLVFEINFKPLFFAVLWVSVGNFDFHASAYHGEKLKQNLLRTNCFGVVTGEVFWKSLSDCFFLFLIFFSVFNEKKLIGKKLIKIENNFSV